MSGAMNPESGMAAPPAERLPVWLKITHGFGSIAYGVKENGFATFLLLFYNQVIGLDAGLVGTAIMLALIADAFVDPVIGELSDRTQTRWGRRLPWLYGAPIPLAVAWMLLWNPPEMSNAMTVAWLVGFAIVVRTLVSMCEVPSVALVPELTGDYDERTAVMRYRFLFGWAGGLVIMIMAYAVFFRANGPGFTKSITVSAGRPMMARRPFTMMGRCINTGFRLRISTHRASLIFLPSYRSLYSFSFLRTSCSAGMPSIRRMPRISAGVGAFSTYSTTSTFSSLCCLISCRAVLQVEQVFLKYIFNILVSVWLQTP